MDLWLTESEKAKLIQELEEEYASGNLDEGAYPILRRLNTLPGVASTQCCMGHKKNGMGHLSIRVTQAVSKVLEGEIIPELIRAEIGFYVDRTWEPWYAKDESGIIARSRYLFFFKRGGMTELVDILVKRLSFSPSH